MFEKIRDILAKQLKIDKSEITLESNIVEDLGADSLDMIELIMAIEEEYDFEVPDDDVTGIKTVADAVEYIETKV